MTSAENTVVCSSIPHCILGQVEAPHFSTSGYFLFKHSWLCNLCPTKASMIQTLSFPPFY